MRITKSYEERRKEILDVAEALFVSKGYIKTSVNDILSNIGIAKGTFYYYFKSKEEVLDAIIDRFISAGIKAAEEIVEDDTLSVHEKFLMMVTAQKPNTDTKKEMINQLHEINNYEMHQKSLVETVKQLSPIMAKVVEQGIEQGLFHTPYPKEAVEFLLVASSFIFDEDIFDWQPDEIMHKVEAFIHTMEVNLGAEKGSFSYMYKAFGDVNMTET